MNNIRKIIICFFIVFLTLSIFGCKKNSICNVNNKTLGLSLNKKIINSNIDGVWILEDYIDKLKTSNSPFLSSKDITGIFSIKVDSNSKKCIFNLNNVETSEAELEFKEGSFFIKFDWDNKKHNNKIEINDNELSFFINSKKLIFIKINNIVSDFGIDYITNKILFEKKTYTCYDEDNNELMKNITFETNGKLINFFNYDSYKVQTSFIVDKNPKDLIMLENTDKNFQDLFYYEIKNNDLLIYRINVIKDTLHNEDDEDYEDLEKFELKYFLKINK